MHPPTIVTGSRSFPGAHIVLILAQARLVVGGDCGDQ